MSRGLIFALLLGCSSSASNPDAAVDAAVDAYVPHCQPGPNPSPYPCCYFWTDASTVDPNSCTVNDCVPADPDAAPPECRCSPGYACAVICPSPLGGCGGAPTCCRLP